ncbi:WD40 repeat-containing protein [Tieghemostelium lacteum]|uniref:WD40 repeat-containing protein n=1 Tax=Tieghemostelium lacteum TaxID=361077 RepID=A0A152A0N8_TIELA|nr:WD40 repeat-containing protein [Tieghemostelium lacteum]|eukprot:KYQ99807.1 WD40 repeat-containing protein [Tieghemostelium lacteum]
MSSQVKTWHGSINQPTFLQERSTFDKHTLGVTSLDINLGQEYLVTGDMSGHIRLFNLRDNTLYKDIDSGALGCWKVAFNTKGNQVISMSQSGNVSVWSVETGEKLRNFQNSSSSGSNHAKQSCLNFALSPNGEQIAISGADGVVSVYELESGKKLNQIQAHVSQPIRALCYSLDSQYIFTGSDDCEIRMHDPQSSKPYISSFQSHNSFILSIAVSPDGKRLASSGADKKVCIWDIKQKKLDHTFQGHTDQIWSLSFSQDSTKLISVSDDCSIVCYSLSKI